MALMYEVRDVLGVGEGQGSVDLSWGANPQIRVLLLSTMRFRAFPTLALYSHSHTLFAATASKEELNPLA